MTNYYHVLGLTEDASQNEIRAAFKKLAVKYHPDKHQGRSDMEEKFKEINLAHQILSDEYEKARFDLKLKYQQFSQTHTTRPYDYRPPKPQYKYKQRSRYYQNTRVDYKQNAIATAYAFGITLLIALIVMGGVWAKQGYDEKQRTERLAERRSTFKEAKKLFHSADYEAAFNLMSKLNFFSKEELDMRVFKDTMMEEIIDQGDREFNNGDYSEAIILYELVQNLHTEKPYFDLKKRLAEAYKKTKQPERALDIYKEFLVSEYEHISTLAKIGLIYKEELDNPEEALEYFLTGHRLAIKRYKQFYGDGYALVISEKYVPQSHYLLYTNLAEMYREMEDYDMALKAADWNKYVWPDSSAAYITSAETYAQLGNRSKACEEFTGAMQRNWTGEIPYFCN